MLRTLTKNLACWAACAAAIGLSAKSSPAQDSDWTPGIYMRQATTAMMDSVRRITESSGFGYDGAGPCLVATYLDPTKAYAFDRYFDAGETYYIVAGGDEDATDVDLEVVVTNSGQRIVADTEKSRRAVVEFTPDRDMKLTIKLQLFEAKLGSFCSFVVLRKNGGWDVPIINVETVVDRFFARCTRAAEVFTDEGYKSGFVTESNQMAVWGALVSGGRSSTILNLRLGDKESVILADGDSQAEDIDLFVKDRSGAVLVKDEAEDASPVVSIKPSPSTRYTVEVKNAKQDSDAALILVGVVQRGAPLDE